SPRPTSRPSSARPNSRSTRAADVALAQTTAAPPGSGAAGRRRVARRRRQRVTPYVLLIPAVVLELLVHIVPMLYGAWMSLLKLTQFYIRNWSAAPFVGLGNYRTAINVN